VLGKIAGSDPDPGDVPTLTFEHLNPAGSAFQLLTDGTLKVVNSPLLNFEVAATHQLSVRVRDATRYKDVTVSIAIGDLNEQTAITGSYSFVRNETVAAGTVLATVTGTDPDKPTVAFGQRIFGFLVGGNLLNESPGGRLAINQTTGVVTAKTAISYEDASQLSFTIAARDNLGAPGYTQATTPFILTLNDINEQNWFAQTSYSYAIAETAATTDVLATLVANDPDLATRPFGKQAYYFLVGGVAQATSQGDWFKIEKATGKISPNKALDRENMPAEIVATVIARDNEGNAPFLQASTEVRIQIQDVNEQNWFTGAYRFTIDENPTAPSVGQVAANDPDSPSVSFGQQRYYFKISTLQADGTVTIRLDDESGDGRYSISATTGAITVLGAISFEAGAAETTYIVVAEDNPDGTVRKQAETPVTISVTNRNEQNVLPETLSFTVAENGDGTEIATMLATDPDGTAHAFGVQRYGFKNGTGAPTALSSDGRLRIDAITGVITTEVALNFETMPTTTYAVVARDNYGADGFKEAESQVEIKIGDLNETPDVPTGPLQAFFNEGPGLGTAQAGTVFASYVLRDDDGTIPELKFAAGGNPNDWFEIVNNQVVFKTTLNYETLRPYFTPTDANGDGRMDLYLGEVKVYATDGVTPSGETKTKIYLSDLNENPNNFGAVPQTPYSEMLPGDAQHAGSDIATFSMTDPDGTTPELRILAGNDHGWFGTGGGTLKFASANFTAQWLRDYRGTHGTDAAFLYDRDNDGLMEIRVATLTLAAFDTSGARSDTITYSIFIEDKNEAPTFTLQAYSFAPSENPAYYQQVGTIGATDVDAAAGELRYLFAGQSYHYDGALGRYVSASSDGKFLVDLFDGRVWVNGTQALDFEGTRTYGYQTVVYDRSMGAHSLSATSSVTMNLQDVNEAHSLQSVSFSVNEANVPYGPMIPVPNSSGTPINLRSAMLSDPEGRNMRWQFSNGSTVMNGWQIEQDGTLRMVQAMDYEAMTDVYEEQTYYDEYGEPYTQTVYVGRDPSRAVVTLGVQAIDDNSGVVTQANLTLNIADVNEDVAVSSYASYQIYQGSAWVQQHALNHFWVKGEIREGRIVAVNAIDPERQALSYSLSNVTRVDFNINTGDVSNDIDSAHPILSIDGSGMINFYLPYGSGGGRDIAWQGGTRTAAMTRAAHSIEYSFDVSITDQSGRTVTVPYKVTFIRRGWSAPPIVLDLDGDGLELVNFNGSGVTFDMDEDGIRDVTGWVAADDGLLALDRNGDGTINDFSEISFKRDDEGALTDLEGLRAFDTNANGFLDAGDERWSEFRIWRDLNQDGVSQDGELVSLDEGGIANINLTLTLTGESPENANENVVYGTTQYGRTDGTQGTVGDVFLAFDPSSYENMAAPIVLDYDGDGSGLVSIGDSNARFDMDGDGDRDRTGWIAAGDALLVLDRNGDGAITDIAEISFIGDKEGATTDLEGLAGFDSDGDGAITTHDVRFGDFRLWFDNDGDGQTGAGELLTLAQAQIASISLGGAKLTIEEQSGGGNRIHAHSAFTREDGSSGTLLDAAFAYEPGAEGSGIRHSGWNGEPAPSTVALPEAAEPPIGPVASTTAAAAPPLPFDAHSYRGGSGRYRLSTEGGELVVGRAKPRGAIDGRAGAVGPASILSFGNRRVGYLAPLVLDLDGDGAELRSRGRSGARFDMDGNGAADDSGWIGRGDAFLVLDANGNGVVDSAAELSLLGLKTDAKNSFEALATLDSNRNGRIDAGDARFGELRLWEDRNGNGVTEAGELGSLAERGVASIDLAARAGGESVKIGRNAVIATGSFTRADGSTGSVADAALAFRPAAAPAIAETLRSLRSGGRETSGEAPFRAALAGPGDPRIAYLVQQMAAFGPGSGEGLLGQPPASANDRYDYFAA
jgi:hypothetical protein